MFPRSISGTIQACDCTCSVNKPNPIKGAASERRLHAHRRGSQSDSRACWTGAGIAGTHRQLPGWWYFSGPFVFLLFSLFSYFLCSLHPTTYFSNAKPSLLKLFFSATIFYPILTGLALVVQPTRLNKDVLFL